MPVQTLPRSDIGTRIKALRQAGGLSLARLAAMTPMSEATLSRIENGLSDVTATNLYAIAAALDAHVSDFFADRPRRLATGLRSVNRAGGGTPFRSGAFASHILSADLSAKKMTPFANVITARTLGEAGGLNAHGGEEFLMVTDGRLILYTEHYEPLVLETGDSIYFDATTPHAYVNGRPEPTAFLVITSERPPREENQL